MGMTGREGAIESGGIARGRREGVGLACEWNGEKLLSTLFLSHLAIK
jgi:hypothetical protein